MHLTGRSGRQKPWWLAVGVLACLLFINIANAAPVSINEIGPDGKLIPNHQDDQTQIVPVHTSKFDSVQSGSSVESEITEDPDFRAPSFASSSGHFDWWKPASDAPTRSGFVTRAGRWLSGLRRKTSSWYSHERSAVVRKVQRLRQAIRNYKLHPQRGGAKIDLTLKMAQDELEEAKLAKLDSDAKDFERELAEAEASRGHRLGADKATQAVEHGEAALEDAFHGVTPPHLRKRAYTEHPSINYRGEGWKMYYTPHRDQILFDRYMPYADRATMGLPFHEWDAASQRKILKTIPAVKDLQKNGWDVRRLQYRPTIGAHVQDSAGIYTSGGKPEHQVMVRSKNGRFEFNFFGKTKIAGMRVGPMDRQWATFEQLPEHMKRFLRMKSTTMIPRPDWAGVVRHVRKRSLSTDEQDPAFDGPETFGDQPKLYKRAPTVLRTIDYPGRKIVLSRVNNDPRTPYRLHFLADNRETVTSSSKWSELPQWLRQKLDGQVRNMGFVASSDMPAQQARSYGVQVGSHAFDHGAGYAHPDYPAETVRVLKKSSGKVVFQRGGSEPVKFSELPEHLQRYLRRQDGIQSLLSEASSSASRFRFKRSADDEAQLQKRAGPQVYTDSPMHSIPYHGERITLTKAHDGSYMFNFLRLNKHGMPETVYSATTWERLPSALKNHFRTIPGVRDVAKSRMSVDHARGMPVLVADHSTDIRQAFSHPEKPAETINIWGTDQGIMFQRRVGNRVRPLVHLSDLPSHLQQFLGAQPELSHVMSWARQGRNLHP